MPCTPFDIAKYQRKLSGPIIDRIDMYVSVYEIDHTKLLDAHHNSEPSATVAKRVAAAHARQQDRYQDPYVTNASLTNKLIKRHATLTPIAKQQPHCIFLPAVTCVRLRLHAPLQTLMPKTTLAHPKSPKHCSTARLSKAEYQGILQGCMPGWVP